MVLLIFLNKKLLKSKEGRSLDLSKGLSIQSVNFDSFRSSSSDFCISGTSAIPKQQIQNSSNSSTTNNSNKKPSSSTPLLDQAQIDSDHDASETPRQNRMSLDQN